MGYKKEMKLISIPKTKNEALLDWFLTEIHWAKLAETLNYSKAGIFKLKKGLVNIGRIKVIFQL